LFNRLILKENQHRKKCPAFAPLYPIVKYKYFRKSFSLEALEAAGTGSNLGFNNSHLEKQESLTEVVT
jgi:hypothetical protein